MKVFTVCGVSKTGKTTTIEMIIKELRKRRFTVGSVKEIHFEEFKIDSDGTNTDRHKKAGSQLVTARGYFETDVLYQKKLSIDEILMHYDYEFVVLEGVTDGNFPKIITAKDVDDIEKKLDDSVIAISGVISNDMTEYKGIPVINAVNKVDELVDLILNKVYEKLPDFPPECCSLCGCSGCRDFGIKLIHNQVNIEDCVIRKSKIKLIVGDREIAMVPFVQNILYNSIEGVVKELDGFKRGIPVEIKIGGF